MSYIAYQQFCNIQYVIAFVGIASVMIINVLTKAESIVEIWYDVSAQHSGFIITQIWVFSFSEFPPTAPQSQWLFLPWGF